MSSVGMGAAVPTVKLCSFAAICGRCESIAAAPASASHHHVFPSAVRAFSACKFNPVVKFKEQKLISNGSFHGGIRSKRMASFRCLSALTPELKTTLDNVVTSHKVLLFMKGTKDFPQCGFSNTVVQILKSLNVPFEAIDILENELLRQAMKEYSSWPTFPQLYIDSEFFGGCDIVVEAYQSGQLQELLEKAMCN